MVIRVILARCYHVRILGSAQNAIRQGKVVSSDVYIISPDTLLIILFRHPLRIFFLVLKQSRLSLRSPQVLDNEVLRFISQPCSCYSSSKSSGFSRPYADSPEPRPRFRRDFARTDNSPIERGAQETADKPQPRDMRLD